MIGGLLNGFVSWLTGRNTMRANGRVAALLVSEELLQSFAGFARIDSERTWDSLREAHAFGRRASWDESRKALGYALTPDGYMALAAAYSGLAQAAETANDLPQGSPVTQQQNQALRTTTLALNRGMTYLGTLLHRPPVWKPWARRAFDRKTEQGIAKLWSADTNVQAFLAKWGKPQQ